jgi:hypothetical protein
MEIAADDAHLALAYVSAVQQQGYRLTVGEFEAYMRQPDRQPGRPPVVHQVRQLSSPALRVAQDFSQTLRKIGLISGGVARTEVVDPGAPEESVLVWLSRLGWLAVENDRVRVTQLGSAVLRHLEQAAVEAEVPLGIVLDQGDELARARFFSEVSGLGRCALVDRFFSIEALLPVLQSTEIERVLTGTTDKGKLSGLAVALDSVTVTRPFQVRKSNVFHDRFVIPDEGPVWLLGTSVSGLGHRLAVMVKLADEALSGAIRAEFEQEWDRAEVVGPKPPEAPEVVEDEPGGEDHPPADTSTGDEAA